MRNLRNLTLVGILSAATPALAQTDAATEIAALRSEIGRLAERLDRLEQAQGGTVAAVAQATQVPQTAPADRSTPAPGSASPAAAGPPKASADAPASSVVRFSGDLRYRHEAINDEASAERERQRIRARFGLNADLGDNLSVGLTLATGDRDPVSANQTLDGGFDRKSFGVDRAFFTWKATDALSFTGGKMATPFFRPGNHHLIYDNDLNPEGLALRYTGRNWFANYAGLWVDERATADDAILLGGQAGLRHTLQNGARITAGVSYYDYLNTQGQPLFVEGISSGNSLDAAGRYLNDYNEAELFAELGLKAGSRPLVLFADYVVNTEASAADDGFAIGAAYGEATRPGTWRVGYAYQDLRADAVIGVFTDSDFGGGGTDNKGHVVEFTYALRARLLFNFRYFLNERGEHAGVSRDYNRLQADLMFNY
ncbi:MAG TPA: putative porin [Gammaproteobacteria bacterium]|nr:putative porin [Gammaproteobacteria bacterium]